LEFFFFFLKQSSSFVFFSAIKLLCKQTNEFSIPSPSSLLAEDTFGCSGVDGRKGRIKKSVEKGMEEETVVVK